MATTEAQKSVTPCFLRRCTCQSFEKLMIGRAVAFRIRKISFNRLNQFCEGVLSDCSYSEEF